MSFKILIRITKVFERVGVSFLILIFFFKGIVFHMSDLWWCLEMHTIMPAYSFSFCSLSARIAPSHFSYVSQAPVWVQDCVGICCDVTS